MAERKVALGPGKLFVNGRLEGEVRRLEITMHDDFDAPESPEEQAETERLMDGLKRFPFGGQMRTGEQPTPLDFEEN